MFGILWLTACSYVQRVECDSDELDFDALTHWIRELERARAPDLSAAAWWESHREALGYGEPESWDMALSLLYARRSAVRVRHNPWFSWSGTLFSLWTEAPLRAPLFGLVGLMVVPVDVVVAPVWWGTAVIRDGHVDDEHVMLAAQDILQARALGYDSDRVEDTGLYGWPYCWRRHVDSLGYDAEWLRLQGVRSGAVESEPIGR